MDKTVLVVEDNDGNMRLFHDVLQAHGYNVLQAKDGMEHVVEETDVVEVTEIEPPSKRSLRQRRAPLHVRPRP